MDERRLELKVGILLAAAAAGCLGLLFLLGEFSFISGQRVSVDFAHSGGVPEGAPVRLAGVRVGRVRALGLLPARLDSDGRPLPVRMEVEISDRFFSDLRAGASFVVATQGPLGEPFLEIEPGPGSPDPLEAGATIRGKDPPRMDLLMARLSDLLDAAGQAVGDPAEVKGLLREARGLAVRANDLLDQTGPAAAEAVRELTGAARELRSLSASASSILPPRGEVQRVVTEFAALSAQLRRDLPVLAASVQRAADGTAAITDALGPEDMRLLKEAIARTEQVGASLATLSQRAESLLTRLEAGEGSLGGLAKDPQVYLDIKAPVADLKRHPWKILWKN